MRNKKKNPNELNDLIQKVKVLDPYYEDHLIQEIKNLIRLLNRIEFNKLCKKPVVRK